MRNSHNSKLDVRKCGKQSIADKADRSILNWRVTVGVQAVRCNAKFFNDVSTSDCPRFGNEGLESNERIQPPWRKKFLTITEASKYLSISRSKLYQMVGKGQIEHLRIGGAIQFSTKILDGFIEDGKKEKREATEQRKISRIPRLKHLKSR